MKKKHLVADLIPLTGKSEVESWEKIANVMG